jgi:hypothetical protein
MRHTADSKPVKQEVNGTVILPPLVFSFQRLGTYFPGLEVGRLYICGPRLGSG